MKRKILKDSNIVAQGKGLKGIPFSSQKVSNFSTASGSKWIMPTAIKSPPEKAELRDISLGLDLNPSDLQGMLPVIMIMRNITTMQNTLTTKRNSWSGFSIQLNYINMASKQLSIKTITSIVALSGCTLVGGIVAYYHFRKPQPEELKSSIPDSILIKFLKDLKSQSYPHFFLVAGIVQSLKNEVQDQDVFQVMFDQVFVEIRSLFEAKQKVVLGKYHPFTYAEIQQSITNSQNERVHNLRQEFEKLYTNCLEGINPSMELTEKTVDIFNQNEILEIVKEVLHVSMTIIYQICFSLKQSKGQNAQLSLHMPEFIQLIHEMGLVDAKREVLVRHKITQFEPELDSHQEPTSPTELFSKLTQHHKHQDEEFKKKIDKVEKLYEDLVGRFMKEQITQNQAQILIENVKKAV